MTEAPEENSLSTLARFLESRNLERIERMTIAEYADLSDHDSLCYWLEYGTIRKSVKS
jgi:hypothetical protein